MEAVMRQRHAVGLPWRRGDQWGATHATFAGQEQAAAAFERTARPAPRERRRVRKRSVVLKQPPVRERVRRGAKKIIISSILHHPENTLTAVGKINVKEINPRRKLRQIQTALAGTEMHHLLAQTIG